MIPIAEIKGSNIKIRRLTDEEKHKPSDIIRAGSKRKSITGKSTALHSANRTKMPKKEASVFHSNEERKIYERYVESLSKEHKEKVVEPRFFRPTEKGAYCRIQGFTSETLSYDALSDMYAYEGLRRFNGRCPYMHCNFVANQNSNKTFAVNAHLAKHLNIKPEAVIHVFYPVNPIEHRQAIPWERLVQVQEEYFRKLEEPKSSTP